MTDTAKQLRGNRAGQRVAKGACTPTIFLGKRGGGKRAPGKGCRGGGQQEGGKDPACQCSLQTPAEARGKRDSCPLFRGSAGGRGAR